MQAKKRHPDKVDGDAKSEVGSSKAYREAAKIDVKCWRVLLETVSEPRAKRALVVWFRVVFTFAVALCLATCLLVIASLFIADRAPQSTQFWGISLIVSAIFLGLGLLLSAIEAQVVQIARLTADLADQSGILLNRRVFRLLFFLSIGGLSLCGFLAILTYAILARIDQGFAVFG